MFGLNKKDRIHELKPLKVRKESLVTAVPPGTSKVSMTTEFEMKIIESHGEKDRGSQVETERVGPDKGRRGRGG